MKVDHQPVSGRHRSKPVEITDGLLILRVEKIDLESCNTHCGIMRTNLFSLLQQRVAHGPKQDAHAPLRPISAKFVNVDLRNGTEQIPIGKAVPAVVQQHVFDAETSCKIDVALIGFSIDSRPETDAAKPHAVPPVPSRFAGTYPVHGVDPAGCCQLADHVVDRQLRIIDRVADHTPRKGSPSLRPGYRGTVSQGTSRTASRNPCLDGKRRKNALQSESRQAASYKHTGIVFHIGLCEQQPPPGTEVCKHREKRQPIHPVTAVADLLALALLKAPGEWGADIAVGSTQRLGTPMGLGGPSAGYMTTREAFKRNMPGRIIGVSVDRLGNRALRMALQMREQHIKRERATSNICTASALMASMVGFYCVYNGPEGLKRAADTAHLAAATVAKALEAMDYKLAATAYFDTLEVAAEAAVVQSLALESGINFFYPTEGSVRMSFDEVTTPEEIAEVIRIFAAAKGKKAKAVKPVTESNVPAGLRRRSAYLTEPVFNAYRSESALMRYIKQLELRDISLANSMISLGSCTMKLNAAALMQPLSLAGFQNMHPFAPADQAEGYMQLITELENDLATITGFAASSLQPNSGAAGEYTGLMVIRAYHQSRGQGYRNVVLIPASAHGTNPASAAMAGMKIVTVACDANGNIDVEDLEAKAKEYSSELCGLMVTYPSTHGVFESRIREIVDAVHDAGGQVYMDGANMNAQVGLTNPGYIGADVCHLNLHKTFAMPHGGGGPGVGPICVAEHLKAFLPSHSVMATGGDEGITAVASAPWGSALLLPITYGYIKMLGEAGLRRATEMAIVNANYMSAALASEFRTYYSGETGRVGHEMILDLTNFKKDYNIDCGDIAHRLMDYGFHAPTLSFPVHETLMVEPTESEPKAEMDRFIEALVSIKRECEAAVGQPDNVVANAPHTAVEIAGEWQHPYTRQQAVFPLEWVRQAKFFPYVSKIDAGYGDRNLCCRNCE